jgi:glycosyltransferase involved in cell wall biosynthesis
MQFQNGNRIVTIYDMITELMPEQFYNAELSSLRKKQAVDRADHVICISNQTRDDLCKIFSTSQHKISVIYPGVDRFPRTSKNNLGVPKPFFLFVGNRSGYKNFEVILQAVATSRHIKNNFCVVAFGGGDFSVQEKQKIHELGLKPEDVLYRKGNDEVLANYYANAHTFIYPSKYEGFGFPPLEAMAMECPVICSNSSCIPEVVGNAGLTFDPNKIDELANAMETMIFKDQDRIDFKMKGLERQKRFTWEKTTSEMKSLYRTLRSN